MVATAATTTDEREDEGQLESLRCNSGSQLLPMKVFSFKNTLAELY